MTEIRSWEVAGLTDAEGNLDRPLAWDRWWAPRVVFEGDRLVWDLSSGRWVRAGNGLLEGFLQLRKASEDRILAYARRWGVLGICEHGLPASHNPPPVPIPILMPPMERLPWCHPQGFWEGKPWEPLWAWRGYSRKMGAFLNVAAHLREGRPGDAGDWEVLYMTGEGNPTPHSLGSVERDWNILCVVIDQWLRQARVGVTCTPSGGKVVIQFTGAGLFGALTIQLALAAAGSGGLAVCSACGCSYIPSRRPRADQRRYCRDCRQRKVSLRDAAADYRRRVAEARRLADKGVLLTEIARRLHSDVGKVRRWVSGRRR